MVEGTIVGYIINIAIPTIVSITVDGKKNLSFIKFKSISGALDLLSVLMKNASDTNDTAEKIMTWSRFIGSVVLLLLLPVCNCVNAIRNDVIVTAIDIVPLISIIVLRS